MELREEIEDYARSASRLANDHYNVVRQLWADYAGAEFPDYVPEQIDTDYVLYRMRGGFSGTDYNGLNYTQLKNGQSRAGLSIDDLWPPMRDLDDVQQFLADFIEAAARCTAQNNVARDPTKPRWARVCHGAKPCAFCVMLASRGYAYRSKETADFGGEFHKGKCHCSVEASWGGNQAITARQVAWKNMYEKAREQSGSSDDNAITIAMNHLYPDQLSGGVYELSTQWPDSVKSISGHVWEHILVGDPRTGRGGHAATATVAGKTRFPETWDEKKIRWAVKEIVAAPREAIVGPRPNKKFHVRNIEGVDVVVELVWKTDKWRVITSYPARQGAWS